MHARFSKRIIIAVLLIGTYVTFAAGQFSWPSIWVLSLLALLVLGFAAIAMPPRGRREWLQP
jgi:predicted membrane channel-forming protein YqfA (hemolysin III family)